jgi:glycosyltransferase involved in cell wall biosynthesis
MGIDPEKFRPGSDPDTKIRDLRGKIILCVGRLVGIKGIVYLIEAMPKILEHHPDSTLLIIGSGPEYASLVLRTKELKLEQQVRFLGVINHEDLLPYYQSADVFVLPSIIENGMTEAFGVVLLEAMASGCPVIGSNVGGIPDIIVNGESGFLVPERDSDALAAKISQVLSDDRIQKRFRSQGEMRVREYFLWDRIAEQYSGIYTQILQHHRK